MRYQKLPKEIIHRGWTYTLAWRDEDAAVYRVAIGSGRTIGYEIIVPKKQGPTEMFGKRYPAKELYPVDEDWGKLGWSCVDEAESVALAKGCSARCKRGQFKARFREGNLE